MNPKQFLTIGGIVLVVVGLLGFFGLTGPTPDESIFGEAWYFDSAENWAHTVVGVLMLVIAFGVKTASFQKNIAILVGVLGLFFAVYNIFSDSFLGAGLQNPLDLLLHLAVGIWALWAGLKKPAVVVAGGGMGGAM